MRFESQRKRTCGLPFRGRPKHTYLVTSRDFVGDVGAFTDSAQGCERHYYGIDLEWEPRSFMSQLRVAARKSPGTALESTSPGEDPTGAGAERELGFDPQPKAELAQGEYKGAREVLARHVHTAEPRGGPGGVLRTQRTTQLSWMCSFGDI
jgi:hypothetical protein